MPLPHGPELAEVVRLPQVHLYVPAHSAAKRGHILRLVWEFWCHLRVKQVCSCNGFLYIPLESSVNQFLGHVKAVLGGEELPLLREHSVPVQVAVHAEIPGYTKGVVRGLESPSRLLPAVFPSSHVCAHYSLLFGIVH